MKFQTFLGSNYSKDVFNWVYAGGVESALVLVSHIGEVELLF